MKSSKKTQPESSSLKRFPPSSLFDTIKVRLQIDHPELIDLMPNPNVRRDGNKFSVSSKYPHVWANIFSRPDNQTLYIEGSISKFLTGQNAIGLEDLAQGAREFIFAVLAQAGISVSGSVRRGIRDGKFTLTRVDFAAHARFDDNPTAITVMRALRRVAISKKKDTSFYGQESIYIGQHSKHRTLRIYRKDLEMAKQQESAIKREIRRSLVATPGDNAESQPGPIGGMSSNVYGREKLVELMKDTLRFEVTLRSRLLKRLNLQSPNAWTAETGRELVRSYIKVLAPANVPIPSIANIHALPPSAQDKLRALVLGDTAAFDRAPSTRARNRRLLLDRTGIDIDNPLTLTQQRKYVTTVRKAFRQGLEFGDFAAHWEKLKLGANPSTTTAK